MPESQNDFIFAVIGEELGVLGSTLVLVAYLMIIGAGLRIAAQADSAFDKLLAVGVTALLGFQSFIIIAGVTRVLPLTGVALPFVSYGGSSLVVELRPAGPAHAGLRRVDAEAPGQRGRR